MRGPWPPTTRWSSNSAALPGSSAASAASAAIDHVKDLERATPKGEWFSAAVWSDGSYGAPKGIYTSFPVVSDGKGGYSVVQGLELSDWAKAKVKVTNDELLAEREVVDVEHNLFDTLRCGHGHTRGSSPSGKIAGGVPGCRPRWT